MEASFLFKINEWTLIVSFMLVLWLAIQVGNGIGRHFHASMNEASRSFASGMLAGSIGVLGLILGFSFSMALNRYDAAKSHIVNESNAVGTSFLRSQSLDSSDAKIAHRLFQEYAAALNEYYDAGTDTDKAQKINQRLTQISTKLWSDVIVISRKKPDMVPTGIYMQSLNEMIDQASLRLNLIQYRVPEPIYQLLALISVLTLGLAGYVSGLAMMKRSLATTVLALMVTLVILVIIDLERPKRGLIQVENTRLHELKETIETFPTLP